jgi:hypothetical protein
MFSTHLRMTDAAGTSTVAMPLSAAFVGLEVDHQWFGVDACGPMGFTASAGLQVVLQ